MPKINLPSIALDHRPVEGYDFMPSGWCGGCEHCISYPAPTVCLACSYAPDGYPGEPVAWPCDVHRAARRTRTRRMHAAYGRRKR